MVQRVYICSNLKSSLVGQQCDQLEGCNNTNHVTSSSSSFVTSSSSSFVLKKHNKSQEVEHYWLLLTTYPRIKTKPRTVCCQEGEDDKNITPDTTIDYKMSSFLLLHSDFWYNSLGFTLF
jgi:hypothetical protein